MKLRHVNDMPVFLENTAEVIGTVQKAVIGDDYKLSYVVIDRPGNVPGMILGQDLTFGEEMIIITNPDCIKSYQHGEELSVYEKKLGDLVFDSSGRELGNVSDFIISPENKKVSAIEVFGGAIEDMLHGRQEINLERVCWKTIEGAIVEDEGSIYS
jgi:uncharacterized protein YrrD